ncbi:low-density lipoprotein receptor-like [Anolis sagrei]|uniref:low-density lipoprotein receptor-like n=1 Tax=Anolis sagrei TaxID=38937 RepID=UPI003521119B
MRNLSPAYLHARGEISRSGALVRAGMEQWLLPFLFLLAAAEADGSQCANVGEFLCPGGGPCLPSQRLCDGQRDCVDGSDEAEESCVSSRSACREDEFRCSPDAECYPRAFLCDQHPDCYDGWDERGCTPQATEVTERSQTEPVDDPESTADKHWDILTIVALLLLAATVLVVSVPWVSRKAKPLLLRFRQDQASEEQLMRKEQP